MTDDKMIKIARFIFIFKKVINDVIKHPGL